MSSTAEHGPSAWYAPGVTGHQDATPPDVENDHASVEEPVESWLADVAAAPAVSLRPEVGEVIDGVFRIERPLGEGGMGVVYLAQDLTLDRKVAIKLHRVATARAADRLLAEARAAAKIAHENVLVVYEAGTWNGHVFVAMEYVDGWTARQWILEAPRTWQQVLALYLEAGRGLAAAHAHGLVHRDVKPDNVLVARSTTPGGRGRARIADFGLARAASDTFDQSVDGPITAGDSRGVTDGIAGSPAYMAPEQLVRGDVDARADQYGFCVALYEGLFGQRPFEGAELSALGASRSQGAVVLPRDAAVPAFVRRVLRRGLSPDPALRFPGMDALLAELGHDPEVTRRRRLGLGTAIVATGLVTWAAMRRPDPMAGCTDTPAIDTWWTPAQATDLQAALRRSGRPYADDLFERIDAALAGHAAAATGSLVQACEATFVEGTRSSVELQAYRECLTQRGREVAALLDVLGEGDPEVVDRAMAAVDDLTPIAYCDGKTGDDDLADVGPEERPAVGAALELIATMRELDAAGRFDQAMAAGEAGLPEVRALGRPRLLAQLLLQMATTLGELRDVGRASALLREASAAAVQARADLVAAEVGIVAIYIDGYLAADRDVGDQWAALTGAWVELAGSPPEVVRRMLSLRGMAHRAADRFDEALADQKEALALLDQEPSVRPLQRASMLAALGSTYGVMGRAKDSLAALTEATELHAVALGEEHPTYAKSLSLLGAAQLSAGDVAGAERSLVRAIEIGERALGPHSARLVDARSNLGSVYTTLGRVDEALALKRRALEDQRAAGPDTVDTVVLLSNLARSNHEAGDVQQGRELQTEAIALAKQVSGPDSLLYGQQLVSDAELLLDVDPARALGEASEGLAILSKHLEPGTMQQLNAIAVHAMALGATGKCAEAVAPLEAALDGFREALGPDNPLNIGALVWLGRCRVDLGRWDAAIAALEDATGINASIGGEPIPQVVEALARAKAGREAKR